MVCLGKWLRMNNGISVNSSGIPVINSGTFVNRRRIQIFGRGRLAIISPGVRRYILAPDVRSRCKRPASHRYGCSRISAPDLDPNK